MNQEVELIDNVVQHHRIIFYMEFSKANHPSESPGYSRYIGTPISGEGDSSGD
jgi:hypothetical protein